MKYIEYIIENTEPLRISDDSISHQGQTATLSFVPGSSMRGYVIGRFVSEGTQVFERQKKGLFSDSCRFLNAYLTLDGKNSVLIPPPKGFYEDKTTDANKILHNVTIDPDLPDGLKRSSFGTCVDFDNDKIVTYSVEKGSDLKIKINTQSNSDGSMFRNEYIIPGYRFKGYIAVADEELCYEIMKRIGETLKLGNSRSQGYGSCKVIHKDVVDEFPYKKYAVTESQEDSCYMMLLSDTVMRNEEGEYCGISESKLEKAMGVQELKIELCSTTVVDVRGFNRTWKAAVPSVKMYEKGSVFKLSFSGTATENALEKIMESGIGIRRNEGFGQVVFLKDYEKLKHRKKGVEPNVARVTNSEKAEEEDDRVIRQIAKEYLKLEINNAIMDTLAGDKFSDLRGASKSQLGVLEAAASNYRYKPDEGINEITELFRHSKEKTEKMKVHFADSEKSNNISKVDKSFVAEVIEKDFLDVVGLSKRWQKDSKVMGVPVKELLPEAEEKKLKLYLISQIIRYDYKEENNG